LDARARLADILGIAPEAVIFDMDGVLADTEPLNERATAAVLARRGASLSQAEYRRLAGQSSDLTWAWLIERFQLTDPAAVLGQEYVRELLPRLASTITPAPGLFALVDDLKVSGIRLALASSSPRVVVDVVLGALGLTRAFEVVISGEEVAAGKPSPDIFRLAAERLRVAPSHCLVIEDSPPGLEAARRAGVRAVAVETRYLSREVLSADLVVDSLERLLGPATSDRVAPSR
jgi:HAD superfamily hydrolase (TIGR01509 family)